MAAYFSGIALTSFFEDLSDSGMQWTVGAGAGWEINAQTNVLQRSDQSQLDSGEFDVLRGQYPCLFFFLTLFLLLLIRGRGFDSHCGHLFFPLRGRDRE